ncbi:MAG: hypothetical protein GU359_05645 [Desulfurococcales archaeon]|jgi:hypothetical protein|nr:hypothetical protein [Desulfurococcales archaeon]
MKIDQRLFLAIFLLIGLSLGLVAGFLIVFMTGLGRTSTSQGVSETCVKDLVTLMNSMRSYLYSDMIYNIKYTLVLTSNTVIIITVANATNSVDMLNIARTNIETALNATDKIKGDIDIIMNMNISQSEKTMLQNIQTEILTMRASLNSFLNDLKYSINSGRIDPSLVPKSKDLFDQISQSTNKITSFLTS